MGNHTSTLNHFDTFAVFNRKRRMRWYNDESELAGRDVQEFDLIRICDGSRVRNTEKNFIVELLNRDISFVLHCFILNLTSGVFVEIDRRVWRLEIARNRVGDRGKVLAKSFRVANVYQWIS